MSSAFSKSLSSLICASLNNLIPTDSFSGLYLNIGIAILIAGAMKGETQNNHTRLKEYMQKGFTLDDERLKGNGGDSYCKELLDRIRDIRFFEKVLYRQVLDLYATSKVLFQ